MKLAQGIALVVPMTFIATRTSDARAQGLEGAFRLSLDATAAEYVSVTLEKQDAATPVPGVTPGPQPDLTATRTTVGFTGGGAGIGLAGALTDNLVLGGRASVGTTTTEILSQSVTATAFTIVPSLEYLLDASDTAKPFVSLQVGYTSLTSSAGGAADTTSTGMLGGVGLGVHAFVTPSFSIDPAVNAYYTAGSIESGPSKYDQTGVTIWFNIGISGWIRHAPERPAASHDEMAQPAEPAASATPASPASHVSDDRGRLTTSFALDTLPADPPGQRLRLVVAGEPRVDGANASLVVMGMVATKEDAACATADLNVEGVSTPLSDVRSSARAGFAASEYSLQMKVDMHALEKLGESHGDASIGLCGVRRPIAPASRSNVYEWVEQFRTKARAAGTWKDAK